MNSANSLYRKSNSSPGPTLIRTLTKTGNVIWHTRTKEKVQVRESVKGLGRERRARANNEKEETFLT